MKSTIGIFALAAVMAVLAPVSSRVVIETSRWAAPDTDVPRSGDVVVVADHSRGGPVGVYRRASHGIYDRRQRHFGPSGMLDNNVNNIGQWSMVGDHDTDNIGVWGDHANVNTGVGYFEGLYGGWNGRDYDIGNNMYGRGRFDGYGRSDLVSFSRDSGIGGINEAGGHRGDTSQG